MKHLILSAAFCVCGGLALAHSPLETTSPADGAALVDGPTEIGMTFKRKVRLTRVTWSHAGEQSGALDIAGQTDFATEFVLPFEGAGPGAYVIEWRGLGDDGHPQTGSFGFTVD